MKRGFVFFSMLAMGFISISVGQQIVPKTSFVLNLDYAQFRNDDSSSYLEIYYGFYSRLLTYQKVDTLFEGLVKLSTKIRNKATGELVVNDVSPLRIVLKDTSDGSYSSARIAQVGYAMPFGEYTLEVMASDSLSQSRRDSIKLTVSLKSFGTTPTSSDVQLCSSIKNSNKKTDPFYKNSLEAVPNPTLLFGVVSHPMMFSYSELYNLDPERTYKLSTQIVGQDGKIAKETSKSRKYGVKHAVEAGMLNVSSVQSGKYRIRLVLEDEGGSSRTLTEKPFFIYNPHVQTTQPAAAALKASELAGLTAAELGDEFRQAQYVATDQEIKTFSQVTTAEGRREFLSKFWVEVEAGRLGRPAITRMAYLQRVSLANQRYRALSREGWRTDRGRILILYSEPDEIERFPSSDESKPYEIWHYYSIENGVQFVFVDRSGFGDYALVHSTKRGELQDESWQRFLR